MGPDDGGACMLRPRAEALAGSGGVEVPGVDVSLCYDCEEWTSLGKFVDVLGARNVELEIKAIILRHLCYFLSSSAATFKYPSPTSAEDFSLSAAVGERKVYINYDDLVALHDLLFRDLAYHVPLYSAGDGRFGLDNLLQKLCSPWEPCLLPAKDCSSEAVTSNIEPYRAPMLCASLEVFMDELLCRSKTQLLLIQDNNAENGTRNTSRLTLEAILAHVLISAHAPKGLHEPRARPCELSLQSAVILLDRVITDNAPRYLLSHVVKLVSQALEDSMCYPENLHSTAKVTHEKKWFSRFLISDHSKYAKSYKSDANYLPDSPSRQVCLWLVSSVLERGVSLYLKFASAPHLSSFVSTLDNGPQPYAAVSSTLLASCLWNYVCHRGRMSQECEAALESMLNDATLRKGLEECMDQTYFHNHGHNQGHELGQETNRVLRAVYSNGNIERSSGTHFCGRELCVVPVWEEDHSTLIADVLHLMHSALNFITEEAQSTGQNLEDSRADMTREDIDDMWFGLIGSFHQCLPCAGEITAADSVGHVLVFFTDMLYYEAETSISDDKLREYLELLESLLISSLMEHTWRRSTSLPQKLDHRRGENETVDVNTGRWEENESTLPGCYARQVVTLLQGFLEEPDLPEILGGNAISIILQINCFLNDFCEFMDKVLSTNDWREYIPACGRRIARKTPQTVQEVVILDRNVREQNFDHDMPLWDGHPSPDEEREPAEHQPCLANVEGQQNQDKERELAEHDPYPANVEGQQNQDKERELAEHDPCPANVEGQQNQDKERELAEHDLCPANVEGQQNQNKERELAEHDPCPANFGLDKQQLRPSTLPILQRFMKHRRRLAKLRDASPQRKPVPVPEGEIRRVRLIRKCRQVLDEETSDIPTEAEGNQFVAEVLLLEKTSENFDDLNDFIVCKQGRSYTRWLNRRTKFRRRKRTREIWKRSEHKQQLLSMLNIV